MSKEKKRRGYRDENDEKSSRCHIGSMFDVTMLFHDIICRK